MRCRRLGKFPLPAPKLGGATRWCTDYFDSVQYLATQMPAIISYVQSEIESGRPSKSVERCASIAVANSMEDMMKEANMFLQELKPVHDILKELSDVRDSPMALIPYRATKLLLREADREGCPAELGAALRKHLDGLQQKSFMFFWEGVMSFSPMYVLMVREHREEAGTIIGVDGANDLFKSGTPVFGIIAEVWSEYSSGKGFDRDPAEHKTAWSWWQSRGRELFPTIYEAARHYLFVVPVVTECDSLLSIMGWKYDARQAFLESDVIATQMFLRGNLENIGFS